ncbi:MAG: sugar ABC transporter permease [Anaerolineae bacterium]|nr:sugar ABC transporter permease [Anaerolineae bacterium]
MTGRQREALDFYIGVSPWFIGFVLFSMGPIIASLVLSFTQWQILASPQWIGLSNYRYLVADDEIFWVSLGNTLYYTSLSVPLGLMASILLALLVNQKVPGTNVFRTIYYLPSVTAGVAVALLWAWILNPNFGLVNYVLSLVGIKGPMWLSSVRWSKPALILMSLWGVGGGMVIFLAALQGMPEHLYDAAKIDGAGTWRLFRHITMPMLTPTIFFMMVTSIIGSLQTFTNVYVMTQGGPGTSTLMYGLYIYQNAFTFLKMGYACALSWVLFGIILALTWLQFRVGSAWVYYEAELRPQR